MWCKCIWLESRKKPERYGSPTKSAIDVHCQNNIITLAATSKHFSSHWAVLMESFLFANSDNSKRDMWFPWVIWSYSCADQESSARGVPTLTGFFSWWGEEGSKYHYKWANIGPPAKRYLNGVSLAGRWWPITECCLVALWFYRGSRPVLLRDPIFLWFFRGGGGAQTHYPPSGSAHDIAGSKK